MSLTGIRGLSDAYGSWNTTCRSRRSARICFFDDRSPGPGPWNDTWPEVGGSQRRMARPVVDLPEPDSPTSPRVSPRGQVERHVADGVDGRPVATAGANREVLDQVAHRQDRSRPDRRSVEPASSTSAVHHGTSSVMATVHRTSSSVSPDSRPAEASGDRCRRQAVAEVQAATVPGPPPAAPAPTRCRRPRPAGSEAEKGHPGGRLISDGGLPDDRRQLALRVASSSRGMAPSRPTV